MLNKNKLSLLALVAVAGVSTAVGVTQIAITKPGQGQYDPQNCDHGDIRHYEKVLPYFDEREGSDKKGHIEHWCCCDCNTAFSYVDDDIKIEIGNSSDRNPIDLVGINWDDNEIPLLESTLCEFLATFDEVTFGNTEEYRFEIEQRLSEEQREIFMCGKLGYEDEVICVYGTDEDDIRCAYVVSSYGFCLNPEVDSGIKFKGFNCKKLTFTDFDVSAIENFDNFFANCKNLEQLDIACFDMTHAPEESESKSFVGMFSGCEKLKTIYASDKFAFPQEVEIYSDSMFTGCSELCGQYNSTIATVKAELPEEEYKAENATCARIDREYKYGFEVGGDPGYFTEKPTFKKLNFNRHETMSTAVTVSGTNENYKTIGSVVIPYEVNDIYIPEEQPIGEIYQVVEIPNSAFEDCNYMTSITLPTSIEKIGENAFKNCSCLESFYYLGDKESWFQIEKDDNWRGEEETSFVFIHCSDGDIVDF